MANGEPPIGIPWETFQKIIREKSMLLYERRMMDMAFKRVTFIVWTNTPGWFVDEAFKKGLMTTVRPDRMAAFLEQDHKCNVIVYGPKNGWMILLNT